MHCLKNISKYILDILLSKTFYVDFRHKYYSIKIMLVEIKN